MKTPKVKTMLLSRLFPKKEIESLGMLMSRIPSKGIEDTILWISDLVDWVRQPVNLSDEFRLPWNKFEIKEVRIRFLIDFLDNNSEVRSNVQDLLERLLLETDFLGLFTISSHQGDSGVWTSAFERLLRKVLPLYRHDRDLGEIVLFLFTRPDDAQVLGSLNPELKKRVIHTLFQKSFSSPQILLKLSREIRESLVFLTQLGLSLRLKNEIRQRWIFENFEKDPLSQNLRFILDNKDLSAGVLLGLEKGLDESAQNIAEVYRKLEFHGTSMTLVLYLERLRQKLRRMSQLVKVYEVLKFTKIEKKSDPLSAIVGFELFVELVTQGQAKRSLRALLSENLRTLAKKIVDRSSHTGEHYLVRNFSEYRAMFWAAAGGGLLTFVTVLIKYYTGSFKLPLFSEGFVSWINYSGSFILMQMMHLTLATKQPSMTASALAAKMHSLVSENEFDEFVNEFARISRAQFIAAMGNIGAIIPAAYLFNTAYLNLTGFPLMSRFAADYTIAHLHPFQGPTLAFAALTGVLLWLSSLVAGWVENFFIYAETPQALRQNILIQKSLGRAFAHRLAHVVEKQAGGLAGNVALGFLLAFSPIFGKFFGLPLEVRHVTLSAGTLTLAILGSGNIAHSDQAVLWLGIALIGILNFSVSFYCSFFLAARARGISKILQRKLFKKSLLRLARKPLFFLFPQKSR